ncbi:MAG TPA: hypothetical protein VLX32_02025 [Candidatus Acidoferrum sp.]|nr:hypothetical protein [Candidatus Acidoferrum sp.]
MHGRNCEKLVGIGRRLDAERHGQMVGIDGQICNDDSNLYPYVIPTDEELLIPRDTIRFMPGKPRRAPGVTRVQAACSLL